MVVSVEECVHEFIDNLTTVDFITLKEILKDPEVRKVADTRIHQREAHDYYKASRVRRQPVDLDDSNYLGR